jgi:hypothetical protein
MKRWSSLLLSRDDIDPGSDVFRSEAAVSYAAGSGYVAWVRPRNRVDPNSESSIRRMLLSYAVEEGHDDDGAATRSGRG